MADRPALRAPRLRVVMEDGAEHQVQTLNIDMLLWDRTRAARGWPPTQDAPFVWMTFLAWSVLKREGATTLDLAAFEQQCLEVSVIDEKAANPTNPDPGPGSSWPSPLQPTPPLPTGGTSPTPPS